MRLEAYKFDSLHFQIIFAVNTGLLTRLACSELYIHYRKANVHLMIVFAPLLRSSLYGSLYTMSTVTDVRFAVYGAPNTFLYVAFYFSIGRCRWFILL